ncbi:MAG: hypothetical protein HFF61_12850 [Oscillospiraceae bacterium]|nr:hypothetical protein [Oscillospiraceae bacterium]
MRRRFRILAVLLILSLTTALLPESALAAETGGGMDMVEAVAKAQDNDTITISGSGHAGDEHGGDQPWIIDKPLTIEGGKITLWTGGIILGADVTFKNVELSFDSYVRNAIIANGHTLTLENVTAANHSFNLFCGGLIPASYETEDFILPTSGNEGKIIIKGTTNLQNIDKLIGSGNIYAGNLCMGGMDENHNTPNDDGPANNFPGAATIVIEGSASSTALGDIYACGAQQRIPIGATAGKITLPDPSKYTVSGKVSVSGTMPNVYGAGGASAVDVTFSNNGNQASLTMTDISHLTVDPGNLALQPGSTFQDLTLSSGAQLNLSNVGACTVNNLSGNDGILILGQNQTFHVNGTVSEGTTKVAIGGVNYDKTCSTAVPTAGHTYIQAPNSNESSFRLLPYQTSPNMAFSKDAQGNWTVSDGSVNEDINHIVSFSFKESTMSTLLHEQAVLPLTITREKPDYGTLDYLDYVPLTINVNGFTTTRREDSGNYTYTTKLSELSMFISEDYLCVDSWEAGIYTIEIVIPPEYSQSGQRLTASATLTVTADTTQPGHNHSWSADWTTNNTHHWYTCTATDCPITDNSQKKGYADHTPGDWIIDQEPTDSVPGLRHRVCAVCGYEMDREEIPVTGGENPGHTHVWAAQWSTNKTHHWYACTAAGCPTPVDQLNGYAAHTPGDWIIDQQPTASNTGSRHRVCTACGYETDRESIPATGGSSGSNRPSRPSSSSGSSTSTTTQRNPDGSTTTTQTNKVTGTVTETVRNPDGSQTVVETRKDGTVTSTEKAANGSTVKTVETPDGSREITVQQSSGATAQVSVDRWGSAEAEVKLTAKSISQSGATPLPIPDLPVTRTGSAQVTVHTGSTKPVKVEIPVTNPTPGTVAVIVNADGSETVVKTSLLTGAGLTTAVSDGAVVKIVDNSKAFPDTASHWARDAVDFVSARQLFSGQSANAFAPNDTMTRAMLITAVARLDGVNTSGGASWHEESMAWAVQQGVSDGTNPSGQITREQLVTLLYRYAGSPSASTQMPFSDTNTISGYAYDAMRWAVENDILSGYGDGTLAPQAQATRAQAAVMLMRYMNFCGE